MPKVKLSDTVVKTALAARPGKELLLWDTDMPTFGASVRPSGRVSFFKFYRNQAGKARRATIGQWPALTVAQARKVAMLKSFVVAQGRDPLEEKRKAAADERQAISMDAFCQLYLKDYAKARKKPSSYAGDAGRIKNHIVPALGKKPLAQVTRAEVARLHAGMSETKRGANLVLSLLRTMFNVAEQWGYRPEGSPNPARGVKPYPEGSRERSLTGAELIRLGKALKAIEAGCEVSQAAVDAIRLLILLGARRNEVLAMRWEWVSIEAGRIDLPDSKTGPRTIWLNASARAYLTAMKKRSIDGAASWVCPGERPGRHVQNVRGAWRRALALASISNARLHDLRHTFATAGAEHGVGLSALGGLLGHAGSRMTERYVNLQGEALRRENDKIGAYLGPMITGEPETSGEKGKA